MGKLHSQDSKMMRDVPEWDPEGGMKGPEGGSEWGGRASLPSAKR